MRLNVFFHYGTLLTALNYTQIVLFPKVEASKSMSQLRSISLCNVLCKIISKILTNQLGEVILGIISVKQSAFILDRFITDNILVAHELLHSLRSRLKGKQHHMALKLDRSKAYDRLS